MRLLLAVLVSLFIVLVVFQVAEAAQFEQRQQMYQRQDRSILMQQYLYERRMKNKAKLKVLKQRDWAIRNNLPVYTKKYNRLQRNELRGLSPLLP